MGIILLLIMRFLFFKLFVKKGSGQQEFLLFTRQRKMRFIMFRIIIFHRLESMSFRIYRSMKNYRIKDNLSVYKWLLDSLFKKRCKN